MTLLLSESDVQGLLPMNECIQLLDKVYRNLASDEAQNIPRGRIRFTAKKEGDVGYLFHCIPGASRRPGVCAVRLDSESRYFYRLSERAHGGRTRDHRYCGLIVLFSVETGDLVGILPDYTVSAIRVGVTSALATKYMAQEMPAELLSSAPESRRARISPECAVRKIDTVKVYSPNREVAGRKSADQIPLFHNNTRTGIQLAAAGAHILERAKVLGRGREIPSDWFTTTQATMLARGFTLRLRRRVLVSLPWPVHAGRERGRRFRRIVTGKAIDLRRRRVGR